ncbi:MAG: DNA-directed RNA polymerase subunit delta [Bacilli bacterium]
MSIKNMKKEELELLSYKDITNLLLEESGSDNTANLFRKIVEMLELPNSVFDNKIGDYYTMLTTDKRFVLLENGNWDLRTRHTSDKVVTVVDDEDEIDNEDSIAKSKDDFEEENDYDLDTDEDDFDDSDDDLKDLVILDEDELEIEE